MSILRHLVAFALAVLPCLVAAKPVRIVSLNLCTDQLVLALAERARIASLTWLIADARSSPVAHASAGITLNHGRAEEILPLRPDLVLANKYSAHYTLAMLARVGVPVVLIEEPADLGALRNNIRRVGALLGESARAERLIAQFDQAMASAALARAAPAPRALLYRAGGYSVGHATLAHDLLARLGLINIGARAGLAGFAPLPLERLLLHAPEVLITDSEAAHAPALAQEILRHPALGRWRRERRVIEIPAALWSCGTHHLATAARIIGAALRPAASTELSW